jgi:hypothetical protein
MKILGILLTVVVAGLAAYILWGFINGKGMTDSPIGSVRNMFDSKPKELSPQKKAEQLTKYSESRRGASHW